MAIIKSYTSLKQSKKLAEILSLQSADMCYVRAYFEGKQSDWFVNLGKPIKSDDVIPCWSLAALLNVIKPINENTYTIRGTLDGGATISFDEITSVMFQEEEIIDAVFEMVVWLKENGKI